jgi:hypothetical protein
MSENWAQLINAVVGVSVGLGCVALLGELGAGGSVLIVAAMLTIVVPSFMVGVIGEHYRRKREAGKGTDRR